MIYRSVTEARDIPGLRLVLTAHMPRPWGEAAKYIMQGQNLDDFRFVARWFFALAQRPAVQRGQRTSIEMQSEEAQARFRGRYYGEDGPAPGAT